MSSAPGAAVSLRERQRLETRALIRQTAISLALAEGAGQVSIQSISRAAGISPRTFFNHFASKDEALVPDLSAFSEQSRRDFVDRAEPDLLTALEAVLLDHLAQLEVSAHGVEGPRVMKQLLAGSPELLPRVLEVFECFAHQVAALVAERTGRSPEDAFCVVAASTATSALHCAFAAWTAAARHDEPADGAARQLAVQVSAAFSALRQLVGAPDRSPV